MKKEFRENLTLVVLIVLLGILTSEIYIKQETSEILETEKTKNEQLGKIVTRKI